MPCPARRERVSRQPPRADEGARVRAGNFLRCLLRKIIASWSRCSSASVGNLACQRADYDEAARQYQRSLDISERLDN